MRPQMQVDAFDDELTLVDRVPAPAPTRRSILRGRVVVVFGCKGGVGATTLAVNLGVLLAGRLARGAVVVDFDVQMGDALGALDLQPKALLVDLLGTARYLETHALRRRLAMHRSGACMISQAGRIEALDGIDLETARELLSILMRHFDAVIVDGIANFGDLALAALDVATTILLVVTPDVAALRRAARCRSVLNRLGVSDHKLRLVVNRHRRRAAVRTAMIADALGLPVTAVLANDFPTVARAIDAGLPLSEAAPRARVTRDISVLAERLWPDAAEAKPAAPARLWRRLLGRVQPPRSKQP